MISFTLQPGDKGEIYVHPSCIILPYSHLVHFDTEDGGNILLRSGFIVKEYRASQCRIHEARSCWFMSFCSEDGGNKAVWNTGFHIQVRTMSQIMQPQCENIVLLFYFSCLLYTWDGTRKYVTSHIVKLYFICPYTLYIYIYIYLLENERVEGCQRSGNVRGYRVIYWISFPPLSLLFLCCLLRCFFGCSWPSCLYVGELFLWCFMVREGFSLRFIWR